MNLFNTIIGIYPIFFRWSTFLLLCALLSFQAQATTVLELHIADFVMQPGNTPPANDAAWVPLKLPDFWNISRPGAGGDGWYRIHFSLRDVPRDIQAVYLPRLSLNAGAYLNGVFLGDGGKFDEPVARNWNRPLLFPISPALLKPGENTLHIRVHSPTYSLGSLSTIYVGAESVLRPEYEDKFFWRITLSQTTTLIIAAMGLFMLNLWRRRRQDSMYGFFGLSSLVWAVHSSNLFIQTLPIAGRLWEEIVASSVQVFVSLIMLSLLRFLGLRKPLLERALWLILMASPASQLLVPESWTIQASMLWHLATLFSSLAVFWYLLRTALRTPQIDTLLLISALCLNIVFGIHDWLKQASILQSDGAHWLHYGAPVFFLVVGSIMTSRFVQALNQFERLNADLEQQVRAKYAELEIQFANVQDMEKQRAMMEERNRIYRDLHDDVGAKLLGLAISAQRANLPKEADLARSALQDLRDVVSRSAQAITPLADLLADWRAETEQRVKSAGLRLDWHFPEQETDAVVNPEAALNLSRILRESVTNILRHAQASHISIIMQIDGTHFRFSVEDDGVGMPVADLKPHRGMTGMQARAAALNAALDWRSIQPHGCRVEFHVQLSSLTPE